MLLLGIDTSGKHGGIALCRARDEGFEPLEVVPLEGGTFSARLVPQIAELLGRHGFRKEQVDGFAVVSGPGSFTGLRVGLAAVKALSDVLSKPIATVSLLEAMAEQPSIHGAVNAVLDAGRGEVFIGEYECRPGQLPLLMAERIASARAFSAEMSAVATPRAIATPDPNIALQLREAGLVVVEMERPRTDVVARLGWQKLRAGQSVRPEELEANYIRRSDAELFTKPANP